MYFCVTGKTYEKGMIIFKFLAYYLIPLCVIAGFYLGMAWNLALSTRNIITRVNLHNDQINARKRVHKNILLKHGNIKIMLIYY